MALLMPSSDVEDVEWLTIFRSQILHEAKADQQRLSGLCKTLETTRKDLRSALDAVSNCAKTRKVSTSSSGAKSASELEKEVQSLRKLLDGKDALVKDLQREVKTLKDQQVSLSRDDKKGATPGGGGPATAAKGVGALSAKSVVLTPKSMVGGSSVASARVNAAGGKKSPPGGTTPSKKTAAEAKGSVSPTKPAKLSDLPTARLGTK